MRAALFLTACLLLTGSVLTPALAQTMSAAPAPADTPAATAAPAADATPAQTQTQTQTQTPTGAYKPASTSLKAVEAKSALADSGAPAHKSGVYDQQIRTQAMALAKELDDQQVQALSDIRNGFGMIRTVHLVDGDVGHAVTACGKDNPGLKAKMNGRYGDFQKAIMPALQQGDRNMNTAINSGVAGDPKKIHDYLNLIDKAATAADSHLDKRPLTTPEACNALLSSMDRTQDTLTNILKTTQWPQAATQAAKP